VQDAPHPSGADKNWLLISGVREIRQRSRPWRGTQGTRRTARRHWACRS